MVFPGNVDGVHVDDSPGFDTLSTELSVCSWYWADNDVMGHLGYGKPIVSKNYRISDPPQPDDGVNNGFLVYAWFYQGDHSLRAKIQTNQGWLATECTECIEFDIWQHQCLVLGNGFFKVYLNGIETVSQEIPEDTHYLDNEDGMEIGSRQDWSTTGTEYNWTGKIQEVGIWSRALTADEITNLQSCSPSALSEGLFGHWPLNEDVGAQDLSGNGLDGIVLGEISWSSEEETPFCIFDCIADPECNVGCMDQNACNYDLTATYDDGSCTYPGCNDSLACNFDAFAGCDDGTCAFIEIPALPDTINFCDSAYVELDSIYDFVLWSTGDTTTSLVVSESMELGLTVGTGQFCLSDMGFQELFSSDSTTFWLSPGAANWALANSEAHAVGGHLATFASTAEMSAVCSSLGGAHAIFGLYQDENNDDYAEPAGGWNWVTGEPFLWNAWDNNQPNNSSGTYGSEEVGHLRPNCLWNDVPEEFDGYHFIVETPLSNCGCTYSTSVVMIRLQDGCLDPLACNFDPQAECDNGSCDYTCCPGPGCCDTGTTWDYEIEKCVPINSCPEDLNYDGIIGVEDLLTLLSSFGTPCDPPVAEWTCGDPVSYHGYDYGTVLIGEQCWFAENLRTELYQNGELIPGDLSDEDWTNTVDGAQSIYNDDSQTYLGEYGRLYNWHCTIDSREVCPSGWHVPNDFDWMDMELALGVDSIEISIQGWRGDNQGAQLKNGNHPYTPLWNGTNTTEFSALPSGLRSASDANFMDNGIVTIYWTSSPGFGRKLDYVHDSIFRGQWNENLGASIRCIKD